MSRALLTATLTLAGLTACGQSGSSQASAEADKIWNERCVNCHGQDGGGTGPGAAALDPKPRSFKDPNWQASVDNDRIKRVMVEGGAAVGLSAAMNPNLDLKDKPEVQDALVKKIRKLVQ